MTGQGDLLDALAAQAEAIERVERHADADWKDHVLDVIWGLAAYRAELTSDDVWRLLGQEGPATHEPRALGAMLKKAAGEGWVTPTDTYRPSARAACHARPVRVWRSLIYRGAA
jgi:hypothetical protein